jgi:hypothetical protein
MTLLQFWEKFKMDKIEIDGETSDRIIVVSLKESIRGLRENITHLKKKKKLSEWEKMTLEEHCLSLNHLEKTFDYYGGNIK